MILIFMNNFSSRNSFNEIKNQSLKMNYNICKETLLNIKSNEELIKRWKLDENIQIQQVNEGKYQGYIPNCYPIIKIFDTKIYNILSIMHFNHYLSAIEIFKDNRLVGIGPKNFRKLCKNKNYFLNEFSCSTHPHNYFLQILTETGLIGSSTFLLIYLSFFYLLILNFSIRNNENFLSKHILIISFLVNLSPIFPSGNFFNNWNAIIYSLPLGFLLSLYRIKN